MKAIPAFLAISILLAGCGQREETQTVSGVTAVEETATPAVIPPELMTDGLAFAGAPFDKPVWYKLEGGPTPMEGTVVYNYTIKDGVVEVKASWQGNLPRMPAETYQRAIESAVDRLLREREQLPTVMFE